MSVSPSPTTTEFAALLSALSALEDEQLQALIARAQALLLDRPSPPVYTAPLAVEIVGQEERRLLAFYHALAPLARWRALRFVRVLYGRGRRNVAQPR